MDRLIQSIVWTSLWLVTACAAPRVPNSELSVREVFAAHEQASDQPPDRSMLGANNLAGFTRTAHAELEQLFPKLPNPTLMLYVLPHRSGGLPIPGYMTALPMYPADPFALPDENIDASD